MKFRKFALVAMAAATLGLVGCASLTQQCTTSVAYQDGMDDGMTPGTDMNKNYAEACLASNRQALNAAYQKGYNAGVPKRPSVANKTQVLNRNSRD